MSGQVSIFLRQDQVIVIPQAGGGGFSYDIEPSLIVAPDPEQVEQAISEALRTSRESQDTVPPPPARGSAAPVLKKLGLRSYKAFYRGASHCYLYEDQDGNLVMLKFQPANDGGGFNVAGSPPETIEYRSGIGSFVLDYLTHAPKMPAE